jgi:deoxyribonuclease-4
MRIGAHVGVGKGWPQAADYASDVGCECIQLFTRSPRMWRTSPLDIEAVTEFQERLAVHEIGPVFAHTSYLINLGSHDEELYERSVDGLGVELSRALQAGIPFVVTHVGTDPTGDSNEAATRIAEACARAMAAASCGSDVTLLLENSSGSGHHYGGSMGELARLVALVREREVGPVGTCLDTCHAHAYGADVSTPEGWGVLLDELEEGCGRGSVGLLHANDAMFERGSKRDRHAWVGEGEIGVDGFRAMFAEPRLEGVPIVVEMPGEMPEKDRVNIERLKEMRAEAADR